MSQKPDCGCGKSAPGQRVRKCVPCDLDRFCRNHYFTGKLLTARDLLVEQRYMRDKMRLHHRVLHGWGVACGLRVIPHPHCPDLRIIVEPGVAIDPCGYEIVVTEPVEIDLPKSPKGRRKPVPCPPEDEQNEEKKYGQKYETEYQQETTLQYGGYEKPGADRPRYDKERTDEGYDPERIDRDRYQPDPYQRQQTERYDDTPREPCDPPPDCVPLTVCIRYAECEEEFLPAPFDECGCNGADGRQPNRVCEGFVIELRCEEAERIGDCSNADCRALLDGPLEPCPSPGKPACIPLAFIEDYRPGETVVAERINNRDYRRLLPSTRLLEEALRCLAEHTPAQALTRVKRLGWTHGQEYNCHDFLRFFTGEAQGEGSFEVVFEAPVRTDALHRTFQAFVVRHRAGGPTGPMELALSRVWMSSDGLRCWLQVDRTWAERELGRVKFDVYLTLRCNLLVDEQGRPVDGDLLARIVDDDKYLVSAPTGDGVPGGNLESWICVRP